MKTSLILRPLPSFPSLAVQLLQAIRPLPSFPSLAVQLLQAIRPLPSFPVYSTVTASNQALAQLPSLQYSYCKQSGPCPISHRFTITTQLPVACSTVTASNRALAQLPVACITITASNRALAQLPVACSTVTTNDGKLGESLRTKLLENHIPENSTYHVPLVTMYPW